MNPSKEMMTAAAKKLPSLDMSIIGKDILGSPSGIDDTTAPPPLRVLRSHVTCARGSTCLLPPVRSRLLLLVGCAGWAVPGWGWEAET